jgi:hypothetical protein
MKQKEPTFHEVIDARRDNPTYIVIGKEATGQIEYRSKRGYVYVTSTPMTLDQFTLACIALRVGDLNNKITHGKAAHNDASVSST